MIRIFGLVIFNILSFNAQASFPPIEPEHTLARTKPGQVYGIPTYDAAFKYILSDPVVRKSFLTTFIPGLEIESSERLDEHMNPIKRMKLAHDFLHDRKTSELVTGLNGGIYVVGQLDERDEFTPSENATKLFKKFVENFDDLQGSFSRQKYNGTMDFVCELPNHSKVLVEMQVISQDYWDERSLAYVANAFGGQLRRGDSWSDLRKVIGINILGGGGRASHWQETPEEYVRHYKVQEQTDRTRWRYIEGIEIFQYCLANVPEGLDEGHRILLDWVTFFREAHTMKESDVEAKIVTPEVQEAFRRAQLDKLPSEVRSAYDAQDNEFARFSKYTKQQVDEAVARVKAETETRVKETEEKKTREMILGMHGAGVSVAIIATGAKLEPSYVQQIIDESKLSSDVANLTLAGETEEDG